MKIVYKEERLSPEDYIDFLKRTNLGSQYPKERFEQRIAKLVKNVSISLVARDEDCEKKLWEFFLDLRIFATGFMSQI